MSQRQANDGGDLGRPGPHEARSRDRNKQIHTARDTLELSGDNAVHAAKFAQLGVAYAIELAKGTLGPAAAARLATPTPGNGPTPWRLLGLLLAGAALAGLARRAATWG